MRWWPLLTLALLAGPASAARPETTGDLRCIAVTAFALSNKSLTPQQGEVSLMYFLGRIDGREPGLDVAVNLEAVSRAITPALAQAEAKRCGGILQARGGYLQQVGAKLRAKAKQQP